MFMSQLGVPWRGTMNASLLLDLYIDHRWIWVLRIRKLGRHLIRSLRSIHWLLLSQQGLWNCKLPLEVLHLFNWFPLFEVFKVLLAPHEGNIWRSCFILWYRSLLRPILLASCPRFLWYCVLANAIVSIDIAFVGYEHLVGVCDRS